MVSYRFIKKVDKKILKQIISLYKSQGWWHKQDTPRMLGKMIKNSHCFLIAVENGLATGMGRAISDRTNDAYIQDVAVLKKRRKTGIGSEIIKRIVKKLEQDGIKWIGLIAQDNSSHFYKKLGFKTLNDSHPMVHPVRDTLTG